MKQKRFQKHYRNSASKLHKKVGDILRNSPIFSGYKIYQEYPVTKINPQVESLSRCHYDWVLLDLKVVIEVMGEQHYGPVNFGGISDEEAKKNYEEQLIRDYNKRLAATDAGFVYFTIPFDWTNLTDQILYNSLKELYVEDTAIEVVSPNTIPDEDTLSGFPVINKSYTTDWKEKYKSKKEHLRATDQDEKMKKKAKELRRAQYLRNKDKKKASVLGKKQGKLVTR